MKIVQNSPISVRVRAFRARARSLKAILGFASHPPQVVEGALGERRPSAVKGGLGVSPSLVKHFSSDMEKNPYFAPLSGGLWGVSAQALLDVTVLTDTKGV